MPEEAGIQESQAEALSYPTWIPAFAGMTKSCDIRQKTYP
jgi:hypothetical protein